MNAQLAHRLDSSKPGYVCRRLATVHDLAGIYAQNPRRYPHLLSSVSHGTPRARYDILFAFPGDSLSLEIDHRLYRNGRLFGQGDFLQAFDREWQSLSLAVEIADTADIDAPPFSGGWFVFLGYELVGQIEPSVTCVNSDTGLPVASATRFPAAIINDHARQQLLLVCESDRASELLPLLEADATRRTTSDTPAMVAADCHEEDPRRFIELVQRVQEYINAGDVFQVNLSRLWRIMLGEPARSIDLYRRLCAANPAPFAGMMSLGHDRFIISSSPERLMEIRGGEVSTRPIAGTYPRSMDPLQDKILSEDLLRHPKERAEHVMLIDLERNDLGRVCCVSSIQVKEFLQLESYRHVHHIVSEVRGKLRQDITPAQAIRALFPGGTITGCPKVRCMQIIAELENAPRAAYTGSIGYINRDGSLDLNILIRTIIQNGREVTLRAGAGIVADSSPERELDETRAKAKGLLSALGVTA